jgi:FdhD protein
MQTSKPFSIVHCAPSGPVARLDVVATEEPLEIRLDGHAIAVVMRTPGHDQELAAGFLFTEGIVEYLRQIRKIENRPEDNRVLVFLHDGVKIDTGSHTRRSFASSSCGICGKATLDAILTHFPPIAKPVDVSNEVLLGAPAKLRAAQATFETTGGLHAAGIFSLSGDLLVLREDIGRHNAVDKAIGHALLNGMALDETFLLLSGRVSFEILQKSLAARIPVVAAISAPSSLAVEFAGESGQTLIGFLRPPSFNRYGV